MFLAEQQGIVSKHCVFSHPPTLPLTKHTSQEGLGINFLQLEAAQLDKQGQVGSKLL